MRLHISYSCKVINPVKSSDFGQSTKMRFFLKYQYFQYSNTSDILIFLKPTEIREVPVTIA